MKKQILFADGGAAPVLGPSDKAALAATARLTYGYTDATTLKGRKVWRCRLRKSSGLDLETWRSLGNLFKRIDPQILGMYSSGSDYLDLYTDRGGYQFYARNLYEVLRELNSKVSVLPDVVDDDRYYETGGQVVTAGPKNYCPVVEYKVPFDFESWESRHRTSVSVSLSESEAASEKAKSDQEAADAVKRQAEADREVQKAKLAKTVRVVLIVLAVVAVAAVAVVIIKKK